MRRLQTLVRPVTRPQLCPPMSIPLAAETLLIEGADAVSFAHAQFSSNVSSLAVGQWQFSAWLDPQGRVRNLFHLARTGDDRYLLLLRGGTADAMADGLRRFVFRSRLDLTALPPRSIATSAARPLHECDETATDVVLGCDTHSMRISSDSSVDDAWRALQLRAGWPWLPAAKLDHFLPAALSLQRLHAVAVDKGCYPGQEIVARLHFRGGHKRHLHGGTLSQRANAGDVLRHESRDAGCVIDVIASSEGVEALLVINDDVAVQAHHGDVIIFDGGLSFRAHSSWTA